MNCPDCDRLLQLRLDGLPEVASAALQEHLTECPRCRRLHQAAALLEDGLRHLPQPATPVGLQARIIRQVLAERRQARQWQQRVLVAAAVLLIALPAAFYLLLPESNPLIPSTRPITAPPAVAEGPSLGQSVEEARQAVSGLGDRLAGQTREQLAVLWHVATPRELPPMGVPGMSDLEHPLEPAVQSLREASSGMGTGLQTVASSASRAVSYWMRELPSLD